MLGGLTHAGSGARRHHGPRGARREAATLCSTLTIPGLDRLMLPVFKKVIGQPLKGGIAAAGADP